MLNTTYYPQTTEGPIQWWPHKIQPEAGAQPSSGNHNGDDALTERAESDERNRQK